MDGSTLKIFHMMGIWVAIARGYLEPSLNIESKSSHSSGCWALSNVCNGATGGLKSRAWSRNRHFAGAKKPKPIRTQSPQTPKMSLSCQVDDDQRYGPLLLESLLRGMGPAPGRAIGAATQHAHTHLGGQVLEGAKIGFSEMSKIHTPLPIQPICLWAAAAIGCYWWLFPLLLFVVFFFCVSNS